MTPARRFLLGFAIGAPLFGAPFLAGQAVLRAAGELDLDHVVTHQLSHDDVLFSSGLNQIAFYYKIRLMEALKPSIVAIGSSRAMQVRREFFTRGFANLGGTVSSISDLERLVEALSHEAHLPDSALLFVDPWWFNAGYDRARDRSKSLPPFPNAISIGLALSAVKSLKKGNWVTAAPHPHNLGIHALLSGDGFAADGSYHYVAVASGAAPSNDVKFSDTLDRIAGGRDHFKKGEAPDPNLVRRACAAIHALQRSVPRLTIIAPPFAEPVFAAMQTGEYDYSRKALADIAACFNGTVHDFSSPSTLPGVSDCEFIDGFHGGDVVYARILRDLAGRDRTVHQILDAAFVDGFIATNAGRASGLTQQRFLPAKEVDFLRLGCQKQ